MTRLAAAILFLVAAPGALAQPGVAGFGWFAEMAGSCWAGDFPDGKTRHTQCYTTQFGKFMRGTASLLAEKDGRQHVIFEGDSMFAWDEAGKRMVYYIWGSDGNHGRHEGSYAGEELVFPVVSRADPSTVVSRSVWKRLDRDTFEVRRERPSGSEWNTILKVTYRRVPAPK
jgi:hypothetical protein